MGNISPFKGIFTQIKFTCLEIRYECRVYSELLSFLETLYNIEKHLNSKFLKCIKFMLSILTW